MVSFKQQIHFYTKTALSGVYFLMGTVCTIFGFHYRQTEDTEDVVSRLVS